MGQAALVPMMIWQYIRDSVTNQRTVARGHRVEVDSDASVPQSGVVARLQRLPDVVLEVLDVACKLVLLTRRNTIDVVSKQ